MSANEDAIHCSISARTSGMNWVANARMIARMVSASSARSAVGGSASRLKRTCATAARPSQWPEARLWLTMRAKAAASAVSSQGSATPSIQIEASEPNMVTRSSAPNSSSYQDDGKLANANPCSKGCMPAMTTTGPDEPLPPDASPFPPDDEPPPLQAVTNTTAVALEKAARRLGIPIGVSPLDWVQCLLHDDQRTQVHWKW